MAHASKVGARDGPQRLVVAAAHVTIVQSAARSLAAGAPFETHRWESPGGIPDGRMASGAYPDRAH
jgi:hypothetical protein